MVNTRQNARFRGGIASFWRSLEPQLLELHSAVRIHFALHRRAAMSFVIYIAVVIAGLVSVMLGLQLASAPPPVRTATQPQLVEPIRHAPAPPTAKPAATRA